MRWAGGDRRRSTTVFDQLSWPRRLTSKNFDDDTTKVDDDMHRAFGAETDRPRAGEVGRCMSGSGKKRWVVQGPECDEWQRVSRRSVERKQGRPLGAVRVRASRCWRPCARAHKLYFFPFAFLSCLSFPLPQQAHGALPPSHTRPVPLRASASHGVGPLLWFGTFSLCFVCLFISHISGTCPPFPSLPRFLLSRALWFDKCLLVGLVGERLVDLKVELRAALGDEEGILQDLGMGEIERKNNRCE